MKRTVVALALMAAATAFAQQDYPSRAIRLITPAAQGGTTDILARIFGAKLSEVFKQQIVVDNRASAAGVIAGQMTASAAPDGYTLLLAYHQHTVNAALNPKLPYHPVDSFTPITQLTSAGLMLLVNPSTPANNLAEFIDWTKNFTGALNFGSAGIGSGGHLAGELYKLMTGVKAGARGQAARPRRHHAEAPRCAARYAGSDGGATRLRGGRLVRRHRAGQPSAADPHTPARGAGEDPQSARRAQPHRV
jgi:tripartite-type tricarboxylate transporter receptor subunit TctC